MNQGEKHRKLWLNKDQEADKLKKHIKNLESQIQHLNTTINRRQIEEQQLNPKSSALKSVKVNNEIPQNFFDDSSSSEDKASTSNSNEIQMVSNCLPLEKRSSSFNEEQIKEKFDSFKLKISDLENVIKIHMIKEQEMTEKVSELQRNKSLESVNIEYIKNIYVNYLKYKAMKNDKEAKTLEQVLFTALLLSKTEISEIEKLRKKYKKQKKIVPLLRVYKLMNSFNIFLIKLYHCMSKNTIIWIYMKKKFWVTF